jgi:hypothetical protein
MNTDISVYRNWKRLREMAKVAPPWRRPSPAETLRQARVLVSPRPLRGFSQPGYEGDLYVRDFHDWRISVEVAQDDVSQSSEVSTTSKHTTHEGYGRWTRLERGERRPHIRRVMPEVGIVSRAITGDFLYGDEQVYVFQGRTSCGTSFGETLDWARDDGMAKGPAWVATVQRMRELAQESADLMGLSDGGDLQYTRITVKVEYNGRVYGEATICGVIRDTSKPRAFAFCDLPGYVADLLPDALADARENLAKVPRIRRKTG